MPVIDFMLAEVEGMGFIGLFLQTLVTGGTLSQIVRGLPEEFLEDNELPLETFKCLNMFSFHVGIPFFLIAGLFVEEALWEVQHLNKIAELAFESKRQRQEGHARRAG